TGADPWPGFARRNRTRAPWLAVDPLYALDDGLIDQLCHHAPGLFAAGEEAFERDLARATGGGFFFGPRAVTDALLRAPDDPDLGPADARLPQTAEDILADQGKSARVADFHLRATAERGGEACRRRAAYAGWLVCDPAFGMERDALRRRHEAGVRRAGRFPAVPRSVLGEQTDPLQPWEQ